MTPINNQSFSHATQMDSRVPSRTNPRLNSNQAAQAKLFQTALNKVERPTPQNAQGSNLSPSFESRLGQADNNTQTRNLSASELLEEAQRLQEEAQRLQEEAQRLHVEAQQRERERREAEERINNEAERLSELDRARSDDLARYNFSKSPNTNINIDLRSGVGAKALRDLPQIGALTLPQVRQLVNDLDQNVQQSFGDPSFDVKLEQFNLARLMLKGFERMAVEDGKPGLSAADIRRTAAKDGNPNNLSSQDIGITRAEVQSQVRDASAGRRDIDLRSGVGAKALRDIQSIGSLTHQQTLTLRSDLMKDIQQQIRFNPDAVTPSKLDQLALVSLMLNGFERNAAEDGKPGLSAQDLRQVAARTGNPNILSRQDT